MKDKLDVAIRIAFFIAGLIMGAAGIVCFIRYYEIGYAASDFIFACAAVLISKKLIKIALTPDAKQEAEGQVKR